MNAFLSMMRRIFLGAIVVSVLSTVLKGQGVLSRYMPVALVCALILYVVFAFFSWIKTNCNIKKMSKQAGQDLPKKSFVAVFFRALILDIVSPVEVVVNLIRKTCSPMFMFVTTYLTILAYIALWFVAIR